MNIADFGAAYEGNFIRCVKALESALKQTGGEFIWVFPSRAKNQEWAKKMVSEGKPIYFLSGSALPDAKLIRTLIKKHRINLIHSHFADIKTYLPIRIASLNTKIPHIAHVHSEIKRTSGALRIKLKNFLRNESINICAGEALCDSLKEYGFKKGITVTNAVDFSRLDESGTSESAEALTKEKLNIAENSVTVLTFGYNFAVKGVDTALEALAQYDKEHKYTLLICPASHMNEAEQQLKEKYGKIPDFVRLLPPTENIAEYYRFADIFLAASRQEGFSYAVVEAAYCKTALAVSDISAHRQRNIPHCVFFEAGNPEKLFEALGTAYKNKNEKKLSDASEYVKNEFSMDVWTEKIISVYKSFI